MWPSSPLESLDATSEPGEKGAAAVETAITIGLFLFLVGGGIQLMIFAYTALTLQIVANTAIRNETLGSCESCPSGLCSACTDAQRADAIEQRAAEFASGLGVVIGEQEICIKPASGSIDCNANGDDDDAGRPRQVVVITITRAIRFLFGVGTFTIQARAIGKNEPFGPGLL